MSQYAAWVPGQAQKIAVFDEYTEVYLQVSGAAAFFVGSDRGTLETKAAIPAGLQFTQANTNPPYKLTWIGELWIMANAAGSAIEVSPTIRSGGSSIAGS